MSTDAERLAALLHVYAIGCAPYPHVHTEDARDLTEAGVVIPAAPDPTKCETCGRLADGEPGRCHRHFRHNDRPTLEFLVEAAIRHGEITVSRGAEILGIGIHDMRAIGALAAIDALSGSSFVPNADLQSEAPADGSLPLPAHRPPEDVP